MNSQNSLSITEARGKIFDLVRKTAAGAKFFLTDHGRAKAVLMSADEYESMLETIEVERIFPDLDKSIAEVERAMKTGAWKKWPTLADLKRDWGLAGIVAEKPRKKYGVSTDHKAKSKKKS